MENQNKPTEEPSYTGTGESPDYAKQINAARRRRLLIPIILVVAIIFIYQILSWVSSRKQTEKKVVEPSAAVQTTEAAPPPPVVSEVATPPAPDNLTQQVAALNQRVNDDHAQLTKINDTLNAQQIAMSNLNVSIADLAASLEVLKQNVDTVLAKTKAPHKKIVRKSKPQKVVYHIKAIVPGRAWLEDSSGRTISVRVGNRLNNSRVEWISSLQGVVTLSSGEIIQYGANDF